MQLLLSYKPKYSKEQQVSFLGGMGKIKALRPDAESWAYAIEMEMGPMPEMGRIGAETTIWLQEADIRDII